MRRILLVALGLLLLISIAAAQYQVGDPVSDFTLQDSNGDLVSLYDYSDQIIFLAFWEYP